MTMTITPTQTPMTLLSLSASTLPLVFHDVIPISPDDGPDSNYPLICVIDYPPDFALAHDYLRALLQSNERSERALALTTWCLKLNPANYTTWTYRRDILKERGYDRDKEPRDLLPTRQHHQEGASLLLHCSPIRPGLQR